MCVCVCVCVSGGWAHFFQMNRKGEESLAKDAHPTLQFYMTSFSTQLVQFFFYLGLECFQQPLGWNYMYYFAISPERENKGVRFRSVDHMCLGLNDIEKCKKILNLKLHSN